MVSLRTCCAIVATMVMMITIIYALPAPNHVMLQDGYTLRFDPDDCKHSVLALLIHNMQHQQQKEYQDYLNNNNNGHNNGNTLGLPTPPKLLSREEIALKIAQNNPLDKENEELSQRHFYIEQPFDGLQWVNISDFKINHYDIHSCEIKRDIHGFVINATGIKLDAQCQFEYLFEEGMPFLSDKGKVNGIINKASILALVHLHGPHDDDDNNDNQECDPLMDDKCLENNNNNVPIATDAVIDDDFVAIDDNNQNDDEDSSSCEDDSEPHWSAHVATVIPEMELKFTETPWKDLYNALAKEHNMELRVLLSLTTNHILEELIEDNIPVPPKSTSSSSSSSSSEEEGKQDKLVNNNNNFLDQFDEEEKQYLIGAATILNSIKPIEAIPPVSTTTSTTTTVS